MCSIGNDIPLLTKYSSPTAGEGCGCSLFVLSTLSNWVLAQERGCHSWWFVIHVLTWAINKARLVLMAFHTIDLLPTTHLTKQSSPAHNDRVRLEGEPATKVFASINEIQFNWHDENITCQGWTIKPVWLILITSSSL